jgi:hypothetical protein
VNENAVGIVLILRVATDVPPLFDDERCSAEAGGGLFGEDESGVTGSND